MKSRVLLAVSLLIVIALAMAYRTSRSPRPTSLQPRTSQFQMEYFAERDTECGVELLNLSSSAFGPFERVVPVGPNQPNDRLRRNVWELGRYKLKGYFTGGWRGGEDCPMYPEFKVSAFEPWGDLQRCASPGALSPEMQLWTGALPTNQYAPEDFVDGPWPASIDEETCRLVGACAIERVSAPHDPQEGAIDREELSSPKMNHCPPLLDCSKDEHRVQACSGELWCCRLLPENTAAQ